MASVKYMLTDQVGSSAGFPQRCIQFLLFGNRGVNPCQPLERKKL